MNKRIISLISVATIIPIAILAVVMIQPDKTQPVKKVSTVQEQPTTQEVAPAVVESTPEPIAIVEAQPVAQVEATPVVTPQAPVYKWAAEMAQAGIAESDFQYVSVMVLDDNGWKTTGDKVWHKATWTTGDGSLVTKLRNVANHVSQYENGWADAYNILNKAGSF